MKKAILLVILFSFPLGSFADSGFLDDYSNLETIDGNVRVYLNPLFRENGAEYDSVMIDLPEVFISEDSDYKGLKADQMATWSESFREAVIAQIGDSSYSVVEEPGEGVLYIRLAMVDIFLKKPRRRLMSYTPIGIVANAAKNAIQTDFQDKISLITLAIEVEITDSQTGVIMGQVIDQRGDQDEPSSWDEVNALMLSYGERFTCRMENTRRDDQANCLQM